MSIDQKIKILSAQLSSMGLIKHAEEVMQAGQFPISKGDKGKSDLIKSIQTKLLDLGYHMDAGADGAFGNQTKEVVIEFQKQNGLEVTESISKNDYDLIMSGNAKKAPKKRIIVTLGDSITAGGYARDLKKIIPGSRTYTFGYGGKQTGFILGKLDLALAKKPDDIIILAGVNDIASQKSFSHVTGNLKKMYDKAHKAGARVIAVKILPWHARKSSKGREHVTEKVNEWIEAQEGTEQVSVVIEGKKMLSDDPSKYEMSKKYTGDGIHPNKAGKKRLAEIIAEKAFKDGTTKEKALEELGKENSSLLIA
jgi:lysophospholipase L1-like esterase